MKKIGIVSFAYDPKRDIWNTKLIYKEPLYATEYNRNRFKQLKKIAEKALDIGITHLLFPGSTFVYGDIQYGRKEHQNDIKHFLTMFNRFSCIAEFDYRDNELENISKPLGLGVICSSKGELCGPPIQQLFKEAADYNRLRKLLWAETISGIRLRKLDGITFLIWICGETSFFRNRKKDGYIPTPWLKKIFGKAPRTDALDYDIFVNPTHTTLGYIGHFQKRLIVMSRGGRYSIQNCNICYGEATGKSMYCYYNAHNTDICSPSKQEWAKKDDDWAMHVVERET